MVAASIGCSLAQTLPQLIAARFLQALGGGSGMVVGRAMIRDLFGPEFYFFEIQDHDLPEQKTVIRYMREFAKHYNIPLLATNDCHYTMKEDAAFHDVLLCIQTGKTLQDQKRWI